MLLRDFRIVIVASSIIWLLFSILAISSGSQLRYPDEADYNKLALTLLEKHAYLENQQPTAYRPPGYPFVLMAVYSVWNSPLAAKLLNAFACALTAVVLALIVASIKEGVGKIIAPFIFLCYPLFAYTATTLYSQTLGTLMFVSVICILIKCPYSWKGAFFGGLLFGFLILTIPGFLLLTPLFFLYLLVADWSKSRPWWRRAVIFSICAAFAVLPWTARNYFQLKAFIPVSTNSGINLLLGNSANTTASSGVNVDIARYTDTAEGMGEVQKDAYFKQCAVSYVKEHPGAALRLYLLKTVSYFNYHNILSTQGESSRLRDLVMFVSYYPLLLLVLIRLFLYRRFPLSLTELFLYLLYFGNAFLSAIFFTRIRFRIPFDALLIVIVALFIGMVYSQKKCSCLIPEKRKPSDRQF